MSSAPSLSLALRWLLTDHGLTETELAASAGVSPGAVAAFLHAPSAPTQTWLTLLAALRCRLEVKAPKRFISVAMPKISAQRRTNERHQWEARHLAAFRAQILRQSTDTTPSAAHATAQTYVSASITRLDESLSAARSRLETTHIDCGVAGPRAAVRVVAQAAEVNAEDLALLSGMSLGATQAALDQAPDGRLAIPHRLFSAIAVRLVIIPAGGGAVTMELAPPGTWRPEAPRPGRTSLTHDQILHRVQRGESMAAIARNAGVSRQRIHAIVQARAS
ncbi:MAG: hypothetical protein AAB263_08990 [Planctomycetota bacterium]|mgnify:CR=1 FL=1